MDTQGDPRVHLVMNAALSATFVYVALWGLDFVGAVSLTLRAWLLGTLALMAITHVLV